MKKIPLTQGKFAIVDNEDFDSLNQHKWFYNQGYAVRNSSLKNGKRKILLMHRVIVGIKNNDEVDHISGNTLDNRKNNLRTLNHFENCFNRIINKNNNSGYKGVFWHKLTEKWVAQIRLNRKAIHLGLFDLKEDAAKAYNNAAQKYFGEFSRLNEIVV